MSARPTAARAMPAAMVGRGPIRAATRGARPEAAIIITAIGISASVDSSPDQPSAAWKNGKSTTAMPAWTPKTTSRVSEPPARPRSPKSRTSSRAASRRCSSQATKPTAPTRPTARPSSVRGAVQPCSGPSCRTRMRPTTATAETSAPTVSNGWAARSRELGTDFRVMARATATRITGRTKSHRQVATSTRRAERNMPRMPPPPATPVQTPMALPRCSAGKVEVMTARVMGMIIAAPTPLATRTASSISAVGARPAAMFAAPKTPSPAISMGLRPSRSPRAPSGSSRAARARV